MEKVYLGTQANVHEKCLGKLIWPPLSLYLARGGAQTEQI